MLVAALALGSAAFLGVGFVLQQRAAEQAPATDVLSPRLFVRLVHQRVWLAGIAAMITGQILGGAALGMGSLAVVEPILAANLFFALPLAATIHRRHLGAKEWFGAAALVAGLAGFLLAGAPSQGGPGTHVGWTGWLEAAGAIVLLAGCLTGASRRVGPPLSATLMGSSAGILYGLQDSLTRTSLDLLGNHGVVRLLTSWYPYGLVAVAVVGLLLAQSAFTSAPLAASLPVINIGEPLAGIALGIGLFHEELRASPLPVAVEILALVLMAAGVHQLASSRLVTMVPRATDTGGTAPAASRGAEAAGTESPSLR